MINSSEIAGKKFGRLTAIERLIVNGRAHWRCVCECKVERVVAEYKLKTGHTKSCGCLVREVSSRVNRTHGYTSGGDQREYRIWLHMKTRCDPDRKDYETKNYSQRGILCCDRWLNSFVDFISDMGNPPTQLHTLDRIDGSKGYYPENCRWATMREQSNNRRGNRVITFNGESMTLQQWSEKVGIKRETIAARLNKGKTVEAALTLSVATRPLNRGCDYHNHRIGNRVIEFGGVKLTLQQWSKKLGIKRECLATRLNRGWSVERAITTPAKNPNVKAT